MDELLRRLAANGFADIEGLEVTGTLPVRQDIVNDLLTKVVTDLKADKEPAPVTEEAPKPQKSPGPNWWKLVNKLEVRMTDGKLILDFELRR